MSDQNSALVKVLAPALAESELARLATEQLLVDLVGTVGEYFNQRYMPDGPGVSDAKDALRAAIRPLATAIDARGLLLAELREAVRVQPLTVRVLFLLNIGAVDVRGKVRKSTEELLRTVEQHILPALPPERSRLELVDGAWGEVMGFRFTGNACTILLRCHRRGQAVPVAKA